MSLLGTETAFEVLARARALEAKGKHVVHLEIGEPDFDTPKHIVDAACAALNAGYTHYGPSAGDPELRQVICDHMAKSRNLEVTPDEVVVVPGAKPIIYWGITAVVNPGDEVIYPNPGFPIYESMINFVGAKPVPVPLREEHEFRLDAEELRGLVTDKTRMIIINSPHNPTGGVLEPEDLQAIADIAIEKDIVVMTDEPYESIIYEGVHHSLVSLPGMKERTILIDGFSKSFAMTGWRLGYGVMPADLAAMVARLQTNCTSCTSAFTQRAGIAALQGTMAPTQAMVAEFKRRRDVIVAGLNSLPGVSCLSPHGAFYVFPNITGTGLDCRTMAQRCLDEAGVAVLSGTAFGEYGEGYLRLSYANSVENIELAISRIGEMLAG
jgi:aspartate/methionine/tyrosine aminotransferase